MADESDPRVTFDLPALPKDIHDLYHYGNAKANKDHGHAAGKIGVVANFDSRCPSTAR
jgi:hypothetical protein